ncbi:SgcJ/EcaC family oxidoreductase [Amycolatopsis sp. H20-H5]|uniref:SgcJ/EcaC family oxidoreductase n=1 Tax=Amycolatopsis sp. H20-H5 TaxID=3046309 RepID=UPI002DBAC538|nr:SgcJ/EcaC family oxidoreductase [Amycolatopsis sp. H20-H5]MEC3982443.1 SgcJ/EcaC family oxidoreductase [Amycolatopsis sp. H20-H5]
MTLIDSTTAPATDETAVLDVLQQAYAAWAANDADAFAALYVADATVVTPGVFHRGRSAMHGYLAGAFAGPLKGSHAIDEVQSVRVLGDSAIVVSKSVVVMAGEKGYPAEREVLATWVLARQDERWLVAAYANAPAR